MLPKQSHGKFLQIHVTIAQNPHLDHGPSYFHLEIKPVVNGPTLFALLLGGPDHLKLNKSVDINMLCLFP